MRNLFAWASIDENGNVSGGKAGNQTGKELRVDNYYQFGQDKCIRFCDKKYGRLCAKYAKGLAKNKAIGYDQSQRMTLYSLAEKNDWSYSKLKKALRTTKVECDCSSFASTVINLAYGKRLVGCCTTATICNAVRKTGRFGVMKISEAEKTWHKGDMPLKEGKHIIINV